MGFCNSCGRPNVKEDYGTNEDRSLNPEFCKDYFQNGKYIEPDITLIEMIVCKSKEMMEKNPRFLDTNATSITTNHFLHKPLALIPLQIVGFIIVIGYSMNAFSAVYFLRYICLNIFQNLVLFCFYKKTKVKICWNFI